MIDTDKLLNQFMGASGGATPGMNPGAGRGDLMKGAAVGGILGLLLGSKKARKMAGGLVGYGGAAAAGALAFKAYQNWQQGKQATTAPVATSADVNNVDPRFLPVSIDSTGQKFSLTLMTAMIFAAKADGHIDATEQAINNSAVHISSTACGSSGWPNNTFGYGRVDILAAAQPSVGLALTPAAAAQASCHRTARPPAAATSTSSATRKT